MPGAAKRKDVFPWGERQRERPGGRQHSNPVIPLKPAAPSRYATALPPEKLGSLLGAIDRTGSATIHFTSPYAREGSEIIAFETAYIAAMQTGRNVLFIDAANKNARDITRKLKSRVKTPLGDILHPRASNDTASPFVRLKGTSLFFATLLPGNHDGANAINTKSLASLLAKLSKRYDLIVIHSDSAIASGFDAAFAPVADSTVIVAEAERTRIPVVKTMRKNIESGGGKVIGTILNRRRYYIPRVLYAVLFRK